LYELVLPGKRLIDGDAINDLANLLSLASTYSITAHAGGGRTSATALNFGLNAISTVATAADSVILPSAQMGSVVFVSNAGANAAQVFAQGSDTIDGTAGATGISLAASASAVFMCAQATKWTSISVGTGGSPGTFTTLTVTGTSSFGGAISTPAGSGSSAGTTWGVTAGAGGATGAGGPATIAAGAGGATSGNGGAASLTGGAGTNGNATGGAASLTGGAGQGSANGGVGKVVGGLAGATGTGGQAQVTGGAGGATSGNGGAAVVTGGAGTAGNATGGAVTATGGAGQGSANGGPAIVSGGAGGATGVGGSGTVAGGNGGATSGAGGQALVTGGNGSAGNANGGSVVLTGGTANGSGVNGMLLHRSIMIVPQGNPTAATTSATLTAAQVLAGIITVNQGAAGASAQQLPDATAMDTAMPDVAAGDAFDFSVINISTVAAESASLTTNTGWTLVGDMDIQANSAATTKSAGRFRARKTGSAAWTLYRLS